MPTSAEAQAGLRLVVEWNPTGARMLLAILRERPAWVMRKDDPYGPLHLIQHALEPMTTTGDGRIVALRHPPFPIEDAARDECFGREWQRGENGKRELADAINGLLAESGRGDAEGVT